MLNELAVPPGARAQHGVPVGLSVVSSSLLGVSLEADAHEDVATAHTDELLDDGVRLLGMDVLQHVRAKHHIKAVVFIRQVGQNARLDVSLGEHVGALLLKDGTGEFYSPSVLSMLTHEADQSPVTSARVEEGVELHLLDHIDREAAAPAALRWVATLGPRLVVQLLVRVTLVYIPGATLRRNLARLNTEEELIFQVSCRVHRLDLAFELCGLATEQCGKERPQDKPEDAVHQSATPTYRHRLPGV
mmetsp:Transcript_28297/g.47495  ORF Transcript_28297/g.47495 Transcript_28297/m.47495 type:complete len:246 (-) Transcript_28297:121-858(-)